MIFSPPVSFGTTELRIKPLPLSFLSWIRHAVEIKLFLKHVFICRRHSRKHTNLSKTVNIDYRAAFLLCHKCRSTQLSVCQKSSKRAQDFQMLMLQVSCFNIYSSVRVFFTALVNIQQRFKVRFQCATGLVRFARSPSLQKTSLVQNWRTEGI